MLKIDLHTHSSASRDGGVQPDQYVQLLEDSTLDYIAVTDHNTIELAKTLAASLGDRIIIGEEVTTREGEIIGLFLTKVVNPGLSARETAQAIKDQGGIVYIPHPFETVRQGVSESVLNGMEELVDIVEVHNGRAVFQNRGPQAATWARLHNKVMSASSDAHGRKGVGTTYTVIERHPTVDNLTKLLARARFTTNRPPLRTLFYPKANRLKKKLGKQ